MCIQVSQKEIEGGENAEKFINITFSAFNLDFFLSGDRLNVF